MESVYAYLGAKIRSRRVKKGLTQAELARAASLSRGSISNIEAGRQQLLLHHLIALCEALELDLASVIGEAKAPGDSEFDKLDEKARAFVRAGIEGQ